MRLPFGGTSADAAYSKFVNGSRVYLTAPVDANGRSAPVTLTFYDAETGGNQITDLALDAAGTQPIDRVTIPAGSVQVPAFYGPDGVTELWAEDGDGNRALMVTRSRPSTAADVGALPDTTTLPDLPGVATDQQLPARLSDASLNAAFADGVTLPAASGDDDTAALNAILSANPGRRVVGRAGEHYRLTSPLVLASDSTLDMTGCTLTLTDGLNANMLTNAAATAVAIASDGATTAGSNVVTTSLAAQAQVGQSLTVAGAWGAGAGVTHLPVAGLVGAVDTAAGTISLVDYHGAPVNADAAVTGAAVKLYRRDRNITVLGGTWHRGNNGWATTPADQTRTTFNLRRVDGLIVRDCSFTATQRAYNCLLADVTNFHVQDMHFDVAPTLPNTDGVVIHAPAYAGSVENVHGTCGDDFVALHAPDNGMVEDTFGDITDVTIRDLFPEDSGQSAVKLLASNDFKLRRITIDGVHGSSRLQAVRITSDGAPATNVGDVLIQNITNAADSGMIYVSSTASTSRITLRDIRFVHPGVNPGASAVYVHTDTNLGELSIDGLVLGSPGSEGCRVAGTVKSLRVSNLGNLDPSRGVGTHVLVSGNVGHISLDGFKSYMPADGNSSFILVAGGTLGSLHIADGLVSGGGWLLETTSEAPPIEMLLSNVTFDGCKGIAGPASELAVTMQNVNIRTLRIVGIWLPGAAKVTVRGSGLVDPTEIAHFGGASAVAPRVVHAEWRADVAALERNNGDVVFNTNGALACGAGVVFSDGTNWKNRYSGAIY